MQFDPTLSFGAILNLAGFVIGGVIFAITLRGDIRALMLRVSRLESNTDTMAGALVKLAVQDERLTSHASRIAKLEDRADEKP